MDSSRSELAKRLRPSIKKQATFAPGSASAPGETKIERKTVTAGRRTIASKQVTGAKFSMAGKQSISQAESNVLGEAPGRRSEISPEEAKQVVQEWLNQPLRQETADNEAPLSTENCSTYQRFLRGYTFEGKRDEDEMFATLSNKVADLVNDGEADPPEVTASARRSSGGQHHALFDAPFPGRSTVVNVRRSYGSVLGGTEGFHGSKPTKRGSVLRDTNAVVEKERNESRVREASDSVRFLVFGTEVKNAGKDVFSPEHTCGTQEQVQQLQSVWAEMDEDGSGDVEFQEFLSFFSRSKTDRLLGMRCVNYLVGKAKEDGVDEYGTGCTIEDMMRLIWLNAKDSDMDKMMRWFHEAELEKQRVKTPPLLNKKKQRQILENFPTLNWEEVTEVSFAELIEKSLLDVEILRGLNQLEEKSGNSDKVTEKRLLEMFCPRGYRAHRDVRSAVDKKGNVLGFVENEFFKGWLLEEYISKKNV